MKFLAAFVASASAADYIVCSYVQTFYPTADDDCSETASGTSTTKVVVGQCSYDDAQASWFKVTACTTKTVDHEWYTTGACTGTPAAKNKTKFAEVDKCVKTDKASASVYTKIKTLAGDTAAVICGSKITQWSNSACDAIDNTAPTFPDRGLAAAGSIHIQGICYYFGASSKYFKWTKCTAANTFTILWWTDKACTSGAATPDKSECTSCTFACTKYFNGAKYARVDTVVHTHKAIALVAPADSDDARALVAGSMVALSMMYL